MSRARLPTEGEIGSNMEDEHCCAAAEHYAQSVARATGFAPTAAEQVRIARGLELLGYREQRAEDGQEHL